MEASHFDRLTTSLTESGTRRRLLGMLGSVPVVGGLVAAIDEAAAKSGKGERSRRRRHEHDLTQDGRKKGKNKKQSQRCVAAGGSCKKPKKGKARKCCAGLSCDAQTKRCTAPPTPPTPPTTPAICPEGLVACEAGCQPQSLGCCRAGERPCNGACASGNATCADEFAECLAPVTADWYAAVDGCASPCESEASEACHACLTEVLEDFAEPLSRCILVSQTDGTASHTAHRDRVQAEAVPKPCDLDQRRQCRLTAMASAAGQGTAQTLLGAMEGPIGALGGFLLSLGQFDADLNACERQFGCPGGECDPLHGVCCPSAGCQSYDPSTQRCSRSCAQDSYCNAITQTCTPRCKACYDYLVDGRQMPCGQVTNNCGAVLTCNGCASTERCENRRCVPKTCARGRGRAAADDDCCLPQTCEELGQTCGTWDDGCGDTIDCGPCDCEPLTCPADPSTCEGLPDGCGGTLDCPCAAGKICGYQDNGDLGPFCCKPATCQDYPYEPGGMCLLDRCAARCYMCHGAQLEGCGQGECPWGGWEMGNA